jgi:hypothetical protein
MSRTTEAVWECGEEAGDMLAWRHTACARGTRRLAALVILYRVPCTEPLSVRQQAAGNAAAAQQAA